MPTLLASVEAIQAISIGDITELKSLKQPPQLVKMVSEPMCILFGVTPSWPEAKKLWGQGRKFINRLLNFDKDHIEKQKIQAIQKYVRDDRFFPDEVKKASAAAASVCMWVRAIDIYARAVRLVSESSAD